MEQKQRSNGRRKWLGTFAPLFIWAAVIFILGSGLGSMNETSRVIGPILDWLFPGATPAELTAYHGYVRKLAHFVEYAILGLLACRAFCGSRYRYVLSLLLSGIVAVADESLQSLTSSRTGSGWDVLLDCLGGSVAVMVYWIAARTKERRS